MKEEESTWRISPEGQSEHPVTPLKSFWGIKEKGKGRTEGNLGLENKGARGVGCSGDDGKRQHS